MQVESFLHRAREIGLPVSESQVKDMGYISSPREIERVLERVMPKESYAKIAFVAKKIFNGAKVNLAGPIHQEEANQEELEQLFNEIENEKGVDLNLEMQNRGFLPVVNDFNFSNRTIKHLIIRDVNFYRCSNMNLVHCYIYGSNLHAKVNECIHRKNSFEEIKRKARLITDDERLIVQTVSDFPSIDNALKLLDEFQGDGSRVWVDLVHAIFNWSESNLVLIKIKKFGITDEQALREIMIHCAEACPKVLMESLSSFPVSDKSFINGIIIDCFKNNSVLMEEIDKFNLDQDLLIQIALLRVGPVLPQNIHKFGIKDQNALKKIAMQYAKTDASDTARNIKNFGIQDQQARFEIAQECLKSRDYSIKDISLFEITDPQLQRLFVMNVTDADLGADCIKQFNIDDEPTRIHIALNCTQEKSLLPHRIKQFKITNKEALIKIAFRCAEVRAYSFIKCVQDFNIDDQKIINELAIACAKKEPLIMYYLHNFNIQDQQTLFEIGMLCAVNGVESLAEKFKVLNLKDEEARFKIAMECTNHKSVIQHMDNFEITDQDKLIVFALKHAQLHPLNTTVYLHQLKIRDQAILISIKKFCAKHAPIETFNFLEYYNNTINPKAMGEIIKICLRYGAGIDINALNKLYINDPAEYFFYFYSETSRPFEEFPDLDNADISNIDLSEIKNEFARKQTQFWVQNTLNLLKDHPVYPHILKVDDPKLRWRLTYALYQLVKSGCSVNFKETSKDATGKAKKTDRAHCLIQLIMEILKQRGVSFEMNSKVFAKDTAKLNLFLNAFTRLATDGNMNNTRMQEIVKDVFGNPMKRLSYLSVLYDLREEQVLHNQTIEQGLQVVLQEKLENIISLDNQAVEKLHEWFSLSRNQDALYIYLSKLNSLKDPLLKTAINECLQAIINGNFYETRYKNSHLQRIEPQLLQKWKTNREVSVNIGNATNKAVDLKSWFYQKLVVDKHSPAEKLPDLIAYLKGETSALAQDCNPIERLCVEVFQNPEKLVELKQLVTGTEFENDLSALLSKQHGILSNAIAVDTDDFYDILLCGTEIKGSCQRVDGNPGHNKGLLGYIMNGQTRLLAIKAKAGPQGMIKARCLLRLLWDSVKSKPVLLRERFYPSNISTEIMQVLNNLAKEKARDMHVDLVSLDGDKTYPNSLASLGGWAPYEYVDAGSGVQNSVFKITDCRYL